MRFGMGYDAWTTGEGNPGRGRGRGPDGDHQRPHGGGGPRGRRVFDGGELKLVMLKLIGDTPRHGYDLIRELEALTGGGYVPSPGVVYPTLTLLDEMGLIEEQVSAGAKKRFAVTDTGRAHLAEQAAVVETLFARIAELSAHRERTDSAPVRRAMGNLKAVLMHRLGHADLSIEDQHAVAALIDEAAQKIERLA